MCRCAARWSLCVFVSVTYATSMHVNYVNNGTSEFRFHCGQIKLLSIFQECPWFVFMVRINCVGIKLPFGMVLYILMVMQNHQAINE